MPQAKNLLMTVCLLGIVVACKVHAQPFSEIVVFDRSLSVVRNGRASNGLLWSEWLASQLSLPTAEQNGTSYWVWDLGALEPAVTSYLDARDPRDDSLVIVGMAFTSNPERKSEYWAEMSSQISRLAEKGAEHFIVNRNDVIGYSQVGGPLRDRIRELNEFGDPILSQLAEDLGIRIYHPGADGFSGFTAVLDDPGRFGFTNLTDLASTGVPTPDEYVWWDGLHPTTAAHRQLALEAFQLLGVSIEPNRIRLNGSGDSYIQDFDTNVRTMTDPLPEGWVGVNDDAVYTSVTGVFSTPIRSDGLLYSAGSDLSDRALAIGIIDTSEQNEVQFHADVADADISQLRLQFDVEAWAMDHRAAEPGEAGFDVLAEIDTGSGFSGILDFGTITTGASLTRQDGVGIDGNADENRVSFDSGFQDVDVPAGSKLRIRWTALGTAATLGWVFGLDNVELSLDGAEPSLDFNGDGAVDVIDVNRLVSEVVAGDYHAHFDLTNDGFVDIKDLERWLEGAAEHNGFAAPYQNGDANLTGSVDAIDLNALALNWRLNPASWSGGDSNADGVVDALDLNELAINWQMSIPTASANTLVPEPNSVLLLLAGLIFCLPLTGARS